MNFLQHLAIYSILWSYFSQKCSLGTGLEQSWHTKTTFMWNLLHTPFCVGTSPHDLLMTERLFMKRLCNNVTIKHSLRNNDHLTPDQGKVKINRLIEDLEIRNLLTRQNNAVYSFSSVPEHLQVSKSLFKFLSTLVFLRQWVMWLRHSSRVPVSVLSLGYCLCSPCIHVGFLSHPTNMPVGGQAKMTWP